MICEFTTGWAKVGTTETCRTSVGVGGPHVADSGRKIGRGRIGVISGVNISGHLG